MQIMRDKDLCHHEYIYIIFDGNYIVFNELLGILWLEIVIDYMR